MLMSEDAFLILRALQFQQTKCQQSNQTPKDIVMDMSPCSQQAKDKEKSRVCNDIALQISITDGT